MKGLPDPYFLPGDFDTFLKADNNQKSRILEQITGTDIYSDISVKSI